MTVELELAELLDVLTHVVFAVTPQDRAGLVDINDLPETVRTLVAERDRLRHLVRDLWAAWNDDTIGLHRALMTTDLGPLANDDPPGLELSPEQHTLLEETIRWAHEERTVTPAELGNPDWYAYPEATDE
jgi:hypothetical protein